MRRIALLIGALILAIPAGPSRADEASRLSLLGSSSREIRFRAEFPAPLLEEQRIQDRVVQALSWPDLGVEGNPGDPGIPTLRVRVALPPTGDVDLESTAEPLGSMGSVTFPLTPALLESKPERERPEPALAEANPSQPKADYRTPPQAIIENIGWERGLRVATVVLHPVTWDAASGNAAWSRALDVTLRVNGAPSPLRSRRPRPDRVGEASWKLSLINPDAVAAFRVVQADSIPPCAGVPAVWFGNADSWVKIEIDHNGIFGLTRSTLAAAGVPVDTVDPQTFRLYSGPLYPDLPWTNAGWLDPPLTCNVDTPQQSWKHVFQKPAFCSGLSDSSDFREIALWIKGNGDHTFDSGDAVVFYALGPDNFRNRFGLPKGGEGYFTNPYSAHTVYWLTWDSSLPGTPLRIQDVDATPVSGDAEITETRGRIHAEQNTFEDPSLYQVGLRWERWYWERMTSDGGATRSIVSLPHLVPGSAMDAIARFWGAKVPSISDPGEASLHHIQVTVNQINAGLKVWGGRGAVSSFTALDDTVVAVPARAQSEFLFLVPRVASSDPNRLDWVHLAWIDVSYRRDLTLDLGAPNVQSELEIEGQANRRTLNLTGFPAGTPVVFDVTDFRHPRRLVNGIQSGIGQRVSWDRTQDGAVAVGMEGSLSAPLSVVLDPRPAEWLRDTSSPLDYVIITQESWMPEAEVLADWRRQHLYGVTDTTSGNAARDARVRVVSVDDIMDEFAWGMWDPAALRYFLEYAYLFYGGPSDDPLSYCLFLGDATNDPRNYGESGSKDYVPSWEDSRDNINQIGYGNIQYVSDDPLARFDDPSPCPDSYTDLYLGRLPVSSRAEARALIQDKVIRSEASPVYGPWRTKAILIADDICQGGGPDPLNTAHMSQMEEVSNAIPAVFQQDKIYLYEYGADCSIVTKPEAKVDLLKSWSEGAWLVDYVGHGGDVVWADEHVLDLNDTPLLTNDGKYPVVGSFSCSVGKFSNPVRDGLGEAHVRALHGGALVSVAATHLTSAAANQAINLYFVKKLFSTSPSQPLPIGVALMEVKRQIPVAQGDKYVCLGDAASRLSVPSEPLTLSGPLRLDRGAVVSITAHTIGGSLRSGTMAVEARDAKFVHNTPLVYKMPGALLYRGQSTVSADTASMDFTVPISLRGGPDGRIAAYASGTNWDAAGVLSPLAVGGLASTGNDTLGPTIAFSVNGPEVDAGQTVTVTLEDPSGINLTRLFEFRSILLKVTDHNGLEQLRQDVTESFSYDVGSSTHGSLEFRVPNLPPGAYAFSISATDNYNNRSQSALSVEVGNASTALAFEGTHLAYPNPFDPAGEPTKLLFSLNRSAQVTIRVYSVSGRLVRVADFNAQAGANAFAWDGRDEAGDPVANGVYLFRVAAQREGSDDARFLERVVVLR